MRSNTLTEKNHRVAVLTSGLLNRLVMTNFTKNFLIPMINSGFTVDYYGSFGVYQYQGWTADSAEFLKDSFFDGLATTRDVLRKVNKSISAAGGNVRVLRMSWGNLSAKDEGFVENATMFNDFAS